MVLAVGGLVDIPWGHQELDIRMLVGRGAHSAVEVDGSWKSLAGLHSLCEL